jgi:hypothetical protein
MAAGLQLSVQAQEAEEIPRLLPFHPEIPPSFWERHEWLLVVVAGLALAVTVGRLLWRWRHPRPPVLAPPAVLAREALAALPAGAEAGATLSRVSQILREYLRRAFWLPPGETTTTVLCQRLADHPGVGAELAGALTEFLRDNDRRKFAPTGPPQPPANDAARALTLIQQCEERLAALRAAPGANPATPSPKPA